MRDILTLLFLLIAYNFLLGYTTFEKLLPIPLFPTDIYNFVLVISFNLVLFLGWLFGQRRYTVVWLSYLLFSQVIMLSILKKDISIIYMDLPSITLSLMLIWLFESPVERKIKRIMEERDRLKKELDKNREELERLREESKLRKEFMEMLRKEKQDIENQLEKLLAKVDILPPDPSDVYISMIYKKAVLEKQRQELEDKIAELEERLGEYKEREERLKRANARLFKILGEIKGEKEEDNGKQKELAHLRKLRKKLSKNIRELNSKISELKEENIKLKNKVASLESDNTNLRRILRDKEVEIEELKRGSNTHTYGEVLHELFKNIDFSEKSIVEFSRLDPSRKSSFLRELLLLDFKNEKDSLERIKGIEGVFKLKPAGGRIYFTYGDRKRWLILGMLDSEDNKVKDRYIREVLQKSKT